MSAPKMIGQRLLSYIRWQKSIQYLGAGIGGLAVFGSLLNSAFAQSSSWLRAAFIITIVLAAAINGRAYYAYVARESFLREYMYEKSKSETDEVPEREEADEVPETDDQADEVPETEEWEDCEYPESARWAFFVATVLAAIAAVILITATVWSGVSPQGNRQCTANLLHDGSTLVCTGK